MFFRLPLVHHHPTCRLPFFLFLWRNASDVSYVPKLEITYLDKCFLINDGFFLQSCRHRFLKPDKCYFWSRLSESLILSTLGSVRNLTKLKLAIVNDHLLKGIAVHCRKLQDLEIQFALDVSDEGLFALAGKALSRTNGKKKSFDSER